MMGAVDNDLAVLRSQQLPNKLTIAGGGDYDKVWIRDNVYVALAFITAGFAAEAAELYSALFGFLALYEHILDHNKYPENESELLPPRFTTTGAKVAGHWGNKQHDAVGILLFGLGRLYALDTDYVTSTEKRLAQKLVRYLENSRYWEDPDNGIWEEDPTLHASSLAACVRGLEMVGNFCAYDVQHLLQAKAALQNLLPAESTVYTTDMALLTLVWPLGYTQRDIVTNVETQLLRRKGVIRHAGDRYEANGTREPEWVMGVPWLGIAYYELGDTEKARHYLHETEKLYTDNGLPESYLAHNEACAHTPLAWSHAMALVLRAKLAGTAVL